MGIHIISDDDVNEFEEDEVTVPFIVLSRLVDTEAVSFSAKAESLGYGAQKKRTWIDDLDDELETVQIAIEDIIEIREAA